MQQMRRGPKQLRALAEELDARQEVKCQKREIDLVQGQLRWLRLILCDA